jgi:transcriptional regulator with PAS, ATPase and Fis domain
VLVAPSAAQVTDGSGPEVQLDAPTVDAAVEADVIRRALAEHGSVRAAARQLGIAESTLRGRCRKLGIATPRARKGS